MKRRNFLLQSSLLAAAALPSTTALGDDGVAGPNNAADPDRSSTDAWPVDFALNTSTIRGQQLSLIDQVNVVASAGYQGIEPWVRDIAAYRDGGGSLDDVRRVIEEADLQVVSAIGFANWIVDDDAARAEALTAARQEMRLVRAIGGRRIAAPPIGAHREGMPQPSLEDIATRYRALCEVGVEEGVTPQVELWGFSPTLSKLSELAYVVTGAAHREACVLPDFYHIHKGGNDFESLSKIEASAMHCFHINDYPSSITIEDIADKDRVFPGDGDCPLPTIIADLIRNGFAGTFSLELFNPEYWQRDALEVCREGLEKSRQVVSQAMQLL